MLIQKHHLKYGLFLLIILVLSTVWLRVFAETNVSTNSEYGDCSQYGSIIMAEPIAGDTLSGTRDFMVTAQTSHTVYAVNFYLNGSISVGSVTSPSSSGQWKLPFDTRTVQNGNYKANARVHLKTSAGASIGCLTEARSVAIQNADQSPSSGSLDVRMNIYDWRAPTNSNINFEASTVYHSESTGNTDVSSKATYEWKTSIGALKPNGRYAAYSSGPAAGKGTIGLKVSYGGQQKLVSINVEIFASDDNSVTAYPSFTATADNSIPAAGSPDQQAAIQGDIELETCLKKLVGEAAYRRYTEEGKRFSFYQLHLAEQCFAKRRFVVPANLAPLVPDQVKTLPINEKAAKINSFKSVKVDGKEVIQISGIAQPNEVVVIYVFSEPLVLVTKADDQGRWSYTLEDPLEAGSHEAYVTVEDSPDTPVRSSAYLFGIASTTPTDNNPLGLSLITEQQDPITLYVLSGAGLVAVGGLALFLLLRYRRKHRLPDPVGSMAAIQPVDNTPFGQGHD